jgi:hypothetical protein
MQVVKLNLWAVGQSAFWEETTCISVEVQCRFGVLHRLQLQSGRILSSQWERILDISQLYRSPRPVTGIALLFFIVFTVCNVSFIVVELCVLCFVWAWRVISCDVCIFVCCALLLYHCHREKPPFAVQLNNNNNNNNNNNKRLFA